MLAATDPTANLMELWLDPNSLYKYGHAMVQAHYIQDYALQAVAEAGNLTDLINVHYANDVSIINVWPSATQVSVGSEVVINVEVENFGTCTASFDVNTYVGTADDPEPLFLEKETVNNLAPREKRTLTFNWNTAGENVGYYAIKAEAIDANDIFQADNTYTSRTIKVWVPYDISPPSKPGNFLDWTATHNTVSLTWGPSPEADVAGYMVYRDGNLAGYAASTYYTDIGLLPCTEYLYYVKAYDVAGNTSDPSEVKSVTTESY
jgi:hypothetical protein